MKRCSGTSVVNVACRAERRPRASTATASMLYFAARESRATLGSGAQERPSSAMRPATVCCCASSIRMTFTLSSRPSGTFTAIRVSSSTSLAPFSGKTLITSPGDRALPLSRASRVSVQPVSRASTVSSPAQVSTAAEEARALFAVSFTLPQRPGPVGGNVSAGRPVGRTEGRTT